MTSWREVGRLFQVEGIANAYVDRELKQVEMLASGKMRTER